MKFKNLFAAVTVGIVVAFVSSSSSHATLVKALNIKQLTALSHQIVKALVVKKEVVDDREESGAIVNYYTLSVLDWIKGPSNERGDEIFIKQLAQHFRFPTYPTGKTYVFFLPKAHSRTGLSVPIGLEQGYYEIKTDAQGREYLPALKGRLNILSKELDSDRDRSTLMSQLEKVRSDQGYEKFKELIKTAMEKE